MDAAVFIEQNRRAKHEVAAVPEIAGLDVTGGRHRIGFFDKFDNRADLAGNDIARTDIAVLGCGSLRLNAKGHDASRIRIYQTLTTGGDKNPRVTDNVHGRRLP